MEIKCNAPELVSIEKLVKNPRNTNKHPEKQIKALAKIIEARGWRHPVIVSKRSGFVVAGHGRIDAANELGLSEVPVDYQDFESEADEYAFLESDNHIARYAEFDQEKMLENMAEMDIKIEDFDFEEFGLLDFELPEVEVLPGEDDDKVPEVKHDPVTKRGDIWLLGNHRVMCGDSTMIDNVEKLMNGEKADMVFTDPPYNINYQDMNKDFDKIKNDKMSDDDFLKFLKDSIYWDADTMYICCSWKYAHIFKQAIEEMGKDIKAMIVWNKVNPAQNLDKYFKAHEIIWYTGKFGGEKTLRSDVWEIKRQRNTVHPTMKPVEIMEIAIGDQPKSRLIMDSFLGSGSTLIACEKTNRKCYGMELDEHYCDVIINRWQDFTGKEAILESSGQKYNELKPKE